MARYGMVIDVDRCVGCYNCFLACRDEHAGNEHRPISAAQPQCGQKWIDVRECERGAFPKVKVSHVPATCLHCANAPCIDAARDGAVYRRADGIVLIDTEKASGQRDIVSACPYGVIFWNEACNIAQKCTLCAHLLDAGWKEPRCVEACPTGALVFGATSDPDSEVSKLFATRPIEVPHPEYDLKTAVAYLGLPKRFVAGEVAFANSMELPAPGVSVRLRRGEEVLATATDNYGDFEFDGLQADAEYVLTIGSPGYQTHEQRIATRADVNVGTIVLAPLVQSASAHAYSA